MKRRSLFLLLSLLVLTSLACGVIGFVENPASLSGVSYWTAETAVPQPTVTVFLGMSTPVYAATPIPAQITTTPEWITTTPLWTTVTATPWFPPPTATPFGFEATPYWVTTTPEWITTTPIVITETPEPPVTTTPALPMIGFTTPEPLETPYYRLGSFYMHSDVYIGGPNGLVLNLLDHQNQPSLNSSEATYHFLTIRVTNHTSEPTLAPLSDLLFIRHIEASEGETLSGRWVAQNEPLLAASLPTYETQQLDPIPPDESRDLIIGFVTPNGNVNEVGLITNWNRPVEGGLPIWFYLEDDPLGPFTDAYQPPPPTPIVLDDEGSQPSSGGGGEPGGGNGLWPTTGTITRGFGCHELYTGIDGTGFGCPPERPWFHNGVDIANALGTLIWSPIDGTMQYAGPNSTGPDCSDIPGSQSPHEGLGNYQTVSGGNTLHYFGHLSSFLVTVGSVTASQNIANMGSTGCSTGSHLHWMVYQNGNLIDPALWTGPGP